MDIKMPTEYEYQRDCDNIDEDKNFSITLKGGNGQNEQSRIKSCTKS